MADVMTKRVTRLESLMAALIRTVDRVDQQVEQLSAEMRDFKEDTQDFKEEMRLARERSDRAMEEFRQELRQNRKEMRRETERYIRKMGTLAEDLVAPIIPHILHRLFGCPKDGIDFLVPRVKRRHQVSGDNLEFDVVAMFGEYVCINETKSSLDARDVRDFLDNQLANIRDFFPEYAEKKVIGIIASFYVDDSVLRFAQRQGLIVLGFGEELMEVLNAPEFLPKYF